MSTPTDEAQRELERRALRNVRGLVDRLEQSDEADSRAQKRLLGWILVGAVVVALGIAAALVFSKSPRGVTVDTHKPVQRTPN